MPYDQHLADRVRDLLVAEDRITEQRMFGGLAFLVGGHMGVAASGQGGLMVRVDTEQSGSWIDDDGVSPMVMRGREMRGWLRVTGDLDDGQLEQWVTRGVAFARSLPPKRQ